MAWLAVNVDFRPGYLEILSCKLSKIPSLYSDKLVSSLELLSRLSCKLLSSEMEQATFHRETRCKSDLNCSFWSESQFRFRVDNMLLNDASVIGPPKHTRMLPRNDQQGKPCVLHLHRIWIVLELLLYLLGVLLVSLPTLVRNSVVISTQCSWWDFNLESRLRLSFSNWLCLVEIAQLHQR